MRQIRGIVYVNLAGGFVLLSRESQTEHRVLPQTEASDRRYRNEYKVLLEIYSARRRLGVNENVLKLGENYNLFFDGLNLLDQKIMRVYNSGERSASSCN